MCRLRNFELYEADKGAGGSGYEDAASNSQGEGEGKNENQTEESWDEWLKKQPVR